MLRGRGSVSLGSVNSTHKTMAADVTNNSPFSFLVLCSKQREKKMSNDERFLSDTGVRAKGDDAGGQ